MSWLCAEIMVYDHIHDYRQIFHLVKGYHSLKDCRTVYRESLVHLASELDKGADPDAEPDSEMLSEEDKLVLEPTSRTAIVLAKWLVIQAGLCVHPPNAKEGLMRLWGELRGPVLEHIGKGAQDGGGSGICVSDQAAIRDLIPALVWSFSKAGEHLTLVWPESALFPLYRVAWLRDVWLSVGEELGRGPNWREFSAFLQRGQEAVAEAYLEMMGKTAVP